MRETFGVPVLTDVHRVEDVKMVAEYVDVLQIPAYMCQQTSLVVACGETGKPINVKKRPVLAPETINGALSKIHSTGNQNVLLTERGACFGYNRLVADMRSIPIMQTLGAPVCFDATCYPPLWDFIGRPSRRRASFCPTLGTCFRSCRHRCAIY